jgi:hypothetical protein
MSTRLASHNAADSKAMRIELLLGLPVGRVNAKPADVLAEQLDTSTRMIGALVADLIEIDGVCIGSACDSEHPGYFIVSTPDDLEIGVGHIVRRGAAIFRRVRALQRAWERKPGASQTTLFDLLDSDPGVGMPAASSDAGLAIGDLEHPGPEMLGGGPCGEAGGPLPGSFHAAAEVAR